MTDRAEIELLAMKVADIIGHFKTPSHERGVLNGAVQELRRLAAEVETLRAAVKEAAVLADFAECWITDPAIEGMSRLKGRGDKFRKLLESHHG